MPDRTVSARSEDDLRAAMERLLAGRPTRTDGRLIKENLYREAGVSRATMNRATSVIDDWNKQVSTSLPRDRELADLQRELSQATATISRLQASIAHLEEQLTIATTAVAELHVENQILKGQDPTRNVTPLRRSPGRLNS